LIIKGLNTLVYCLAPDNSNLTAHSVKLVDRPESDW
jgi:hypothetical protein